MGWIWVLIASVPDRCILLLLLAKKKRLPTHPFNGLFHPRCGSFLYNSFYIRGSLNLQQISALFDNRYKCPSFLDGITPSYTNMTMTTD